MSADWRLAVDIGGTFTDVVLLDAASGRVVVDKTLTTPHAPLEAVRTGIGSVLQRAGLTPSDIVAPIVHATTLITNALIEGKLGRAAVVTTTGFGDTLEIRDEHRYDMYDLQIEFPPPPVARELVFEIDERTMADGRLDRRPSAEALATLAAELRAAELEAIGLCFLNSYANPANEREVAAFLRAELGIPVCISSEISPQIREYPRMITTACNAATMPVIGPYLDELHEVARRPKGFSGGLLMMLSNGGVVSADDAARAPIRLVESGPAAGALAGTWFARRMNEPTAALLRHGRHHGQGVSHRRFRARAHQHLRGGPHLPVQEGLGLPGLGAERRPRRDRRRRRQHLPRRPARPVEGRPRVGRRRCPVRRATGAAAPSRRHRCRPRPRLPRRRLLPRRRHAARHCRPPAPHSTPWPPGSGWTPSDTAAGIHEVVNQNMAAAARMHAIEMGVDLRGVTLIAFGGAGPVHACGVAELLEAPRVVFPVNASVLSAFGTLVSPVRIDLARSMVRRLDVLDPVEREAMLRRAAHRGQPGAHQRRRAGGSGPVPLRRRRPLRRAGQRDHDLGGRGVPPGRSMMPPSPTGSTRSTRGGLRDVDPRHGGRGRHVAALGAHRGASHRSSPPSWFGAAGEATPHHHRTVRLSRRTVAPAHRARLPP